MKNVVVCISFIFMRNTCSKGHFTNTSIDSNNSYNNIIRIWRNRRPVHFSTNFLLFSWFHTIKTHALANWHGWTLANRPETLANRPETLANWQLAKRLVGETTVIRVEWLLSRLIIAILASRVWVSVLLWPVLHF